MMLRSTSEEEDRFSTEPAGTAEELLYPAAAAEQNQPRRKWGTKQLEAESAIASSRES
jgi:hypothetical protein